MSLDEEVLEIAAKDGKMEYEKWPALLDPLLERLEHIARNVFAKPRVPPSSFETVPTLPIPSSHPTQDSQPNSSNKENAPPLQPQSPPQRPPVPSFSSPTSTERVPDSQPLSAQADDLPPQILTILSSIRGTLKSYFSQKPPHTIQRLAELILRPTSHYKTLPAYLRAVDRVVSVSSGADIFPLPISMPMPSTMIDGTLANGLNGTGNNGLMINDNSLGSDESLGGALLTPIPWLSNPTSPDNGDILSGPVPDTRPSSDTSQSNLNTATFDQDRIMAGDELTNQEQDVTQHQQQPTTTTSEGEGQHVSETEDGESVPHARGPTMLGVEDLGLQDGRGVRMTLAQDPVKSDPTTDTLAVNQPSKDDKITEGGVSGNLDADADADADGDGDIDIMDVGERPVEKHVDAHGNAPSSDESRKGPATESSSSQGPQPGQNDDKNIP